MVLTIFVIVNVIDQKLLLSFKTIHSKTMNTINRKNTSANTRVKPADPKRRKMIHRDVIMSVNKYFVIIYDPQVATQSFFPIRALPSPYSPFQLSIPKSSKKTTQHVSRAPTNQRSCFLDRETSFEVRVEMLTSFSNKVGGARQIYKREEGRKNP